MTAMTMKQGTLVKSLVTVQSVRAANEKLMSMAHGANPPAAPNRQVAQKLGSVAEAGRRAMEAMKK